MTRDLYYPRYPGIISSAHSLDHKIPKHKNFLGNNDIMLIDSPSNPEGLTGIDLSDLSTNKIIWDGAYHTPTYGVLPRTRAIKEAAIYCGSFGKLSGLNGIRLGWACTNDDQLYEHIINWDKVSSCGVSVLSQKMAEKILSDKIKLYQFYSSSKTMIEDNREEIVRLKGIFGSDKISNFGMFAFFQIDDKILNLFEKAQVRTTNGKDCGYNDGQAMRISLGNSNSLTKEMVDRILKVDSIK
jgi:aspartate/methionine/tyrosine aminotransferase